MDKDKNEEIEELIIDDDKSVDEKTEPNEEKNDKAEERDHPVGRTLLSILIIIQIAIIVYYGFLAPPVECPPCDDWEVNTYHGD